jgi:DNA-directed RNA polymerase specialized sigma24 family protein
MAVHPSWSQWSDEQLVAAFLAERDPALFEALRDKFLPIARAVVGSQLRATPEGWRIAVEDVVQEALMQVYLFLPDFDPNRLSFHTWALRFVHYTVALHLAGRIDPPSRPEPEA